MFSVTQQWRQTLLFLSKRSPLNIIEQLLSFVETKITKQIFNLQQNPKYHRLIYEKASNLEIFILS